MKKINKKDYKKEILQNNENNYNKEDELELNEEQLDTIAGGIAPIMNKHIIHK